MSDQLHTPGSAATAADPRRDALTAMVAEDPQRLRRRSIARGVPPADADDVAQTALLRAWRSIEDMHSPGPGQMCSWLDTIARNAAIDLARQQRRRAADVLDDDVRDAQDVQGETEMRIILDGALQAIHGLPASLRDPLLLSVADGLTTQAIAERLGLAPATVRQRISRARKALATCRGSAMSPDA